MAGEEFFRAMSILPALEQRLLFHRRFLDGRIPQTPKFLGVSARAVVAPLLPTTAPMPATRAISLLDVSPLAPSIEAIFQAYDGHDYSIDGATFHVNVHGVYDDGRSKWVQLVVRGDDERLITLRLTQSGSGFKTSLH